MFHKASKELVPYFRDIIDGWVEVVQELAHILDPSLHFWSFDEGEGNGNMGDWRLEPSVGPISAETAA